MHFIVELFANDLGQEILLDVTNPTIVSHIKIVGFGTGYTETYTCNDQYFDERIADSAIT